MAEQKQQLEIPPRGTRGSHVPWGLMRYLRPLLAGQISRYRKHAGAEPPTMRGFPLVLLTTVGAKSGKELTNPVGGFPQGDDVWVVIASKSGDAKHPGWFINLAKNPEHVWLEVGNRKLHVRPEVLKGSERERVFENVVAASPQFGKYQQTTDREIPVIRLTPVTNPPG